jgi:ferredoxin-NADP reductase
MNAEQPFHRVRVSSLRAVGSAFALAWRRDFDFTAGQLVDVALAERGPSRLYSLFTGPGDEEAGILFTLVGSGELTPTLARLGAGDILWIRGPSGSFPAFSGPAVWIANGTGLAPFLSMARAGLAEGKRLLHGARAPGDFYFSGELCALMGERYLRCRSQAGRESRAACPEGAGIFLGRLTAFLEAGRWDAGLRYELCGSASMVVEVRDLLIGKGVPLRNIVSEVYF